MTFRQITNSAFSLSNQTEKLSSGSRILAEGTAFRLSKREESRMGGGGGGGGGKGARLIRNSSYVRKGSFRNQRRQHNVSVERFRVF